MADTYLDLISENDEVIGKALRSEIHAKGLLHREIHIWFITPDKKVIFQKRSMKKDTNPGLLIAAVSGHVELGQTYQEAAFIETQEETGLTIDKNDIIFLDYYRFEVKDDLTKAHNRSIRALFGMLFTRSVESLKIENEDGEGFVVIPFNDLVNPSEAVLKLMAPKLIDEEFLLIKDKLIELAK